MKQKTIFSTKEAAEYLGLTVRTVKYHLYTTKRLEGQMIGNSLVFTKAQLDNFKKNKRPVGRPRKEKS